MGAVVDTMVAHYFLLVDQFDLLLDLLDEPVVFSRIVYDPDDDTAQDETTASEITRNIRHERRRAEQPDTSPQDRTERRANADKIAAIQNYVDRGRIWIVDMSDEERGLFARLTASTPEPALKLLLPLDAGEAASVAIAVNRGHVLCTDDSDALRALDVLEPGHPYERIRGLLVRAAEEDRLTETEANKLHFRMREHGFWDSQEPHPES